MLAALVVCLNTPEDMAAYLAASFSPEKQAAELADPRGLFLIAAVGGETAGYARLHEGAPPGVTSGRRPIEIARFYALKEWIGRGVGAALTHAPASWAGVAACLAEAGWRGCDSIWLDVWERNPRARAFYARWGFVEVGTQTFQLGSDRQRDVIMQRSVAAGNIQTDDDV